MAGLTAVFRINDTTLSFGTVSRKGVIYSTGNNIMASLWDGTMIRSLDDEQSFGSGTHLSLDPSEQFVTSASYGSGTSVVYRLSHDGSLIESSANTLESTDESRAHWAGWSNASNYFYVVLSGEDRVIGYPFDASSGQLGEGFTAWSGNTDDAPRHIAFRPNTDDAYILNELSNTLIAAKISDGGLFEHQQEINLLPEGFTKASRAAHIQISRDGSRLYASNRGRGDNPDSSVAVFQINANGTLTLIEHESGSSEFPIDNPRAFLLIDQYDLLFVANQSIGNILAFSVLGNGELTLLDTSDPIRRPFDIIELPEPRAVIIGDDSAIRTDQCDTTKQCLTTWPEATDCQASQADDSVCLCGEQRCDQAVTVSPL